MDSEKDYAALSAENKALKKELAKLRQTLNVYQGISRNTLYTRLLDGVAAPEEELAVECREAGLTFIGNSFGVVIFGIADGKNLFFEQKPPQPRPREQVRSTIYFIVKNIAEEMAGPDWRGYITYETEIQSCIVNLPDPASEQAAKEAQEALCAYAQSVLTAVEQNFGVRLWATVGRIHSGFSGLTRSYQEAQRVLEYKKMMEIATPVLSFEKLSHQNMEKPENLYSMEQEFRIRNCIRQGDYRKAKEHLHETFSAYFLNYVPSVEFLRCRFWGFLSNMISLIDEFEEAHDDGFMEELDPVTRIINAKTIGEIRTQTDYIFDRFIARIEARRRGAPPLWLSGIAEYLQKNFPDPNINVTTVSDHFQVNPAYAAQLFKQVYGERMLDYLHHLRLEKAKALLQQGASLKETAAAVGYISAKSMARAFKKYEGTTPGYFQPKTST